MLVDTGVMIELLNRKRSDALVMAILSELGGQRLYWSSLQYGELADAFRRKGREPSAGLRRVADLVDEVPVDRAIATLASELKAEARSRKPGNRFGLADGVVLATARVIDEPLLTLDDDFDCFPDVRVLGTPEAGTSRSG